MDMEIVAFYIKLGLVFLGITFICVLDVAYRDFGSQKKQIIWGLVVLIPFLGPFIYLLLGFWRGSRINPPVKENTDLNKNAGSRS